MTLVVIATAVFRFTSLDLWVSDLFFRPADPAGSWPLEHLLVSRIVYEGTNYISVLVFLVSMTILLGPFREIKKRYAGMILVCFLLGPGILVNAVFKDHWGRHRPHEIERFGGDHYFMPIGEGRWGIGGHSFPSGHASVGFCFFAFYFALLAHNRKWANRFLAGSIILGFGIGFTRIMGGKHFVSDVVFAGFFSFLACWFTYHILFRMPSWLAARGEGKTLVRRSSSWQLAVWATALVFLLVFFKPSDSSGFYTAGSAEECLLTARLEVARAEVVLNADPEQRRALVIDAQGWGQGTPLSNIKLDFGPEDGSGVGSGQMVRFEMAPRGVFVNYRGQVRITINPDLIETFHLNLGSGQIVMDESLAREREKNSFKCAECSH